MILAKSNSSLTTLNTKGARWFLATKSCAVTGRSSGSSIFQARNVLLMLRKESDSTSPGQPKPLSFSYTLLACCTDFSDRLLGFLSGTEMDLLPKAMRVLQDELPSIEVKLSSDYSPRLAD